jgi:hypothetical protein
VWLVILVVIQSTTGRPPLQLKLSTQRGQSQPSLRQSPSGSGTEEQSPCIKEIARDFNLPASVHGPVERAELRKLASMRFREVIMIGGLLKVDGTPRQCDFTVRNHIHKVVARQSHNLPDRSRILEIGCDLGSM